MKTEDKLYLERIGFEQDDSKHSGFYYREDPERRETEVLIPLEDSTYKLEIYGLYDDGDGNFYEDMRKLVSIPGETLPEFLEDPE